MSGLLSAVEVEARDTSKVLSRGAFFRVAALLLLTIAAGLRVYHLGDRSLWHDEAVTANISRGTFTEVLKKTQRVSAPVVHPYILYVAEKIGKGAVAARVPSMLASLLAVLMMLAMVRAGISQNAALLSAAILAISGSQIRYAQEVREYSLAVLCAAILVYCLLRWEVAGSRTSQPVYLYAALFIAPLVQYGLVFLAFGILSTIALRLLLMRDTRFKFSHLVIASASLAAGALLTFTLTLHYQFLSGNTPWYLAQYYFDPKTMSLLRFLIENTKGLLGFIIFGGVAHLCVLLAAVIYCVAQVLRRQFDAIMLLVSTSVPITICAALVRAYPYGGARQCLFLEPVIVLFAGVALVYVLEQCRGYLRPAAAIVLIALIFSSLIRGMIVQSPYMEIEDTKTLIKELAKSSGPNDQVWVDHEAVPAFQFYLTEKDPRFIYGNYHADVQDFTAELLAAIHPSTDRLWLAFSNLAQTKDRAQEQLILGSLQPGWELHRAAAARNAELYVAQRKTSP